MKFLRRMFIAVFMIMLYLPLLFVNRTPGQVSREENRKLADRPRLHKSDGTWNDQYFSDVSTWFNDNVGFRSEFISQYAGLQYNIFHNLISEDYRTGPRGEWNYVGEKVLPTYQHINLYTDDEVEKIYSSFCTVNQYLNAKNIQFYYMQCWDKQSIYPEQFPQSVNQYGTVSRTDQILNRLKEDRSLQVVDTKQNLIDKKKEYATYSKYGDPTHWSNRGAYIGYLQLMNTINQNNSNQFRVLKESDYNLSLIDKGADMLGGIHQKDMEESFEIRNPKAKLTNEKLTVAADDERDAFYTNDQCGNHKKVLIIGDSYIQMFIRDDIAESFYETAQVWKYHIADIKDLVEAYQPDIVIYEEAEREEDFSFINKAADDISTQ